MSCSKFATFPKILLMFLLLLSLFNLSGCKKAQNYSDINKTTYENILKEKGNKENKYFIIIYSTACKYCQELEPYVLEYSHKASTLFSKLPKLYVLCVDDVINKDIKASSDDEYDLFVGTTDYHHIKFSAEPGLIEVTNQTVTHLISSKTTNRPFTDIKNYLNKALI